MCDFVKNYRAQPSCGTCVYCFVWSDYDDPYMYYCTKNAPIRPKCGSSLVSEQEEAKGKWSLDASNARHKQQRQWMKWQEGRQVRRDAICDEYEAAK